MIVDFQYLKKLIHISFTFHLIVGYVTNYTKWQPRLFHLRLPAICSSSPGWGENINFIWREVHSQKELHVFPIIVNFFQISMIPISTYWDHIPRACKWNYLLKIQTPHLLPRVELNNKHLLARVKLNKKRAHLDRLGNGRILNRNWNYFLGPEPVYSFFSARANFLKYIWSAFAS